MNARGTIVTCCYTIPKSKDLCFVVHNIRALIIYIYLLFLTISFFYFFIFILNPIIIEGIFLLHCLPVQGWTVHGSLHVILHRIDSLLIKKLIFYELLFFKYFLLLLLLYLVTRVSSIHSRIIRWRRGSIIVVIIFIIF